MTVLIDGKEPGRTDNTNSLVWEENLAENLNPELGSHRGWRTLEIRGHYTVTKPINLTVDSGEHQWTDLRQATLEGNLDGPIFDTVGNRGLHFRGGRLSGRAACGIFCARDDSGGSSSEHVVEDTIIAGEWTHAAIYMFGSEKNSLVRAKLQNTGPAPGLLASHSIPGLTSDCEEVHTKPVTPDILRIDGGSIKCVHGPTTAVLLHHADAVSMSGTFVMVGGAGELPEGSACITVDQTDKKSIARPWIEGVYDDD